MIILYRMLPSLRFFFCFKGDSGGPLLDENYNLLGINQGFCAQDLQNCSKNLATERRFNFHVDLIDEFRLFIDEMKARFQPKSITRSITRNLKNSQHE